MALIEKIDIRLGQILNATVFSGVRKPAYKLEINFGPNLGHRQSSAQLTFSYPNPQTLIDRFILGVVNFPSRSIAGFKSEVLVTGFYAIDGQQVMLSQPLLDLADRSDLKVGSRLGMLTQTGPEFRDEASPLTDINTFQTFKIVLGEIVSSGEAIDGGSSLGILSLSKPLPDMIGKRIIVLIETNLAFPLLLPNKSHYLLLTSDNSEKVSLGTALC